MLIDLDVAPPPEAESRRRGRPRRVKALVVLLGLLLGGSAAPHWLPRPALAARAEGSNITGNVLGPDTLYIARQTATSGIAEVRAVSLSGNAIRWEKAVSAGTAGLALTDQGRVLVVNAGGDAGLIFLDAASGAEIWQTPRGANFRVAGDRAAIWNGTRLSLVSVETGRTVWDVEVAQGGVPGFEQNGTYVVGVDFSGKVGVFDARTGAKVKEGTLGIAPSLWTALFPAPFVEFRVLYGRLYLYGTSFVAAYGLPGLEPQWRQTIATPVSLDACAGRLCALEESGMTVLAPDGGIDWSTPEWYTMADDGVVASPAGRQALVDPQTGVVKRDYGHAGVLGKWVLHSGGHLTDRTTGELVSDVPGISTIGCSAYGDYLACPAAGPSVEAWKIPQPHR